MKLSHCTIGRLVQTKDGEIGHVTGLTYNVSIQFTGNMTREDLRSRLTPLVRFPEGERAIHHGQLESFTD